MFKQLAVFALLFLFFGASPLFSQITPPKKQPTENPAAPTKTVEETPPPVPVQTVPASAAEATAALDKRGIDQAEIERRLRARGIDPTNVAPGDLARVQTVTQEIILEIEKEKAAQTETKIIVKDSAKIELLPQVAADAETKIQKAEKVKANISTVDAIAEIEQIVKGAATLDSLPPSTIFGQSIFRDRKIEVYRQTSEINTPDSYELGPGDKLAISIWGIAVFNGAYEINKEGFIQPQGLSRIFLKGKTFAQAKAQLESEFRQRYPVSSGNFDVTLVASRTLSVNITGEVFNYGTYRLLALNSAFNALVAAGGPTDIGSVRNIQLIRSNGKSEKIDIYEYLLDPSKSKNFTLQEGDNLFIPVIERLVNISGAISRPYKYELIKGENLLRLIELAAGLREDAFSKNIQIRRFLGDKQSLLNVDLDELKKSGKDFELLNGDRVLIGSIPIQIENFVRISGAVYSADTYELLEGMRVGDLVKKALLKKEAQTDYAWLLRENQNGTFKSIPLNLDSVLANPNSASNILLLPKDQLQIFTKSMYSKAYTVQISGAVRQGGVYPFDPAGTQKVSDLIKLAGGLAENAYEMGYVLRTLPDDSKKREYIKINVQKAAFDTASADNLSLREGDIVRIYTNEYFIDDSEVSISGPVRSPGKFRYDKKLRINDVILMSGGLKENAYQIGYVFRTLLDNYKEREYIKFDVRKAASDPNSSENLLLREGDAIRIYTNEYFITDAEVSVQGAVRSPGKFRFDPTLKLQDAIQLSGGLKPEAASNRIEVFRVEINENEPTKTSVANFQIDRSQQILGPEGFELQPYDIIVVRTVPDFEFQKVITINGEIQFPGPYAITTANERVSDVLKKAGGLTPEAFPEGATLFRTEDKAGFMVMELDHILRRPKSPDNFILKAGDIITIPKVKDFVTIKGATRAPEIYQGKVLNNGSLNVAYRPNKNALFYVNQYAAGVAKNGSRRRIIVEDPNGRIHRTENFLFFKYYPTVQKGSVIVVGTKRERKKKDRGQFEEETAKKIDWAGILSQSVAAATSVLTLIVLVKAASK